MQYVSMRGWFFCIGFLLPALSFAQAANYDDLNLKELRKKAEQQLQLGDWYSAIHTYEAAYKKAQNGDASPETQYKLAGKVANLYRKIRHYDQAADYYKTLAIQRSGAYPKAFYRMALMVQQQGLYDSARKLLKQVKARYQGPDAYAVKKRVEQALKGTKKALKRGISSDTAALTHLKTSINSPYSEFSPKLLNDTTLLYASRKVDSLIRIKRGGNIQKRTRFYKAHFKEGEWQHEGPWEKGPSLKGNLGNGAFSQDRKRFYFTKCQFSNEQQQMICNLYEARRKGESWSKARKLPAPINLKGVSSTQPTTGVISKGQQKKAVLIFASDRDRGRGKMDIWYSTYNRESGDYSRPRNMGRKVNTKGNEVTPFYDSSESILFFSSDSRAGYGGLDVYAVKGEFGRFREDSRHLKAPVNSPADDLYYWKKAGRAGFIVSNRPGVETLKHPTCCDDLFATELPTRDTSKKELLAKKFIGDVLKEKRSESDSLEDQKNKTVVNFYKSDIATGGREKVASDTFGDKDSGRFKFQIQSVKSNKHIYATANRKGYEKDTSDIFKQKELKRGVRHARLFLRHTQEKTKEQKQEITAQAEKEVTKRKSDEKIAQEKTRIDTNQRRQKETKEEERDSVKQQIEKEKQAIARKSKEEDKQPSKKPKKGGRKKEQQTNDKIPEPRNEPVVIENINYGFDQAKLDQQARNAIDTTVLELMQGNPDLRVQIRSHTDAAGSDEYNLELSKRRAQRVVDYLVEKGIDRDRLVPKGFGERRFIAPNFSLDGTDNPEGRRKNRRTEFKILNK